MREMLSDALGSPEKADLRLAEHLGMNDEPTALAEQIDRFWNNGSELTGGKRAPIVCRG